MQKGGGGARSKYSHWKFVSAWEREKTYHLHFKALQVPILAEVVGIYGTKRPAPDVNDNGVKNTTNSRHLDWIILHLHQFH